MKRKISGFATLAALACLLAPATAADDPLASVLKRDGHTVSLELKFSRKNSKGLQHVTEFLDYGADGHATGFMVGDGLLLTSYHVVSGNLSAAKKSQMGFGPKDQLKVKAYVGGCQATLVKSDEEADLALLSVCRSGRKITAPAFQETVNKDERLLIIARPKGDKTVKRGSFHGPYTYRGQQFWSARMEGRDGFSGSPVYNDKAELVGVFSGYDWSQKLAVISPGARAQKLLEEYNGGRGQ